MVRMRTRWRRLWMAAALAANGCATSTPPYVMSTTVFTAQQYSSYVPPAVRVRILTPEEAERIEDCPGKKSQELAARLDSLGSLILAPVLLVFFFPEFLNPDNWHVGPAPQVKEALRQFPARLAEALERRLGAVPTTAAGDVLEVAYFADVMTIGPAANRVCFVFQGQIELQSKGEVLYREVIRIDPRGFSEDIPQPECTQAAEKILDCADEVIPGMVETRLPGIPWKSPP